ncbi:MAG: PrsW family glutamic-type intramembrane protease [Peptoniphilaceae bacterium]|nr:PrsW family glutamic-type intramembrane protease [Peptoniphilaceae bacterium]MDY6019512.1 PrsW family glutamic-type intramembrane protease [Anaerococcus sp.]
MNLDKKNKFYRRILLLILILLFLYGFEYELNYFYYEKARASDYLIALASCLLLLIYIIPLSYMLFFLSDKLCLDRKHTSLYLLCGMFIPGFLSAFANDTGQNLIKNLISEDWGLAFTAPINEETIKLFVVLLILFLLNKNSLKDFFISGFAVGFGFQIMEYISYIGSDGLSNMDDLFPMVLSRISGAWSSHWAYTALFALGFYFLFKNKNKALGIFLILFVLFNHFLWDSPIFEESLGSIFLGASIIICLLIVLKKYLKVDFFDLEEFI